MINRRAIICSENRFNGAINGVTTSTENMKKAIRLSSFYCNSWDFINICPKYPGSNAPKNVWEIPSLDISKWVPPAIATVDKGYRIAYPFSTPLGIGKRINDSLADRIQFTNPDCVHLQGTHQVSEHVAYACLKLGMAYGLTLHTYDEMYIDLRVHVKPIANTMKVKHAERSLFIADHAAWVTCPTEWYAEKFRNFTGFTGKIIILPSIVWPIKLMSEQDRSSYERQFRSQLPKELSKSTLVGCFGRQSPEKNLELAIYTWFQLYNLHKHNNMLWNMPALVLIGPGNQIYRDMLKKKAKELGISSYIVWIDGQPYDEMLRLHQIFRYQFFPAEFETQGLMHIEAMMCNSLGFILEKTAFKSNEASLNLKNCATYCACLIDDLMGDSRRQSEILDRQQKTIYGQNDPIIYGNNLLDLYSKLY